MNMAGVDNAVSFTSYTYDKVLDLYFAQARFYDQNDRRFTQQDPIKDGVNWYAYCGNNPVVFVDPSGLAPTFEEAILMSEHIYQYYHFIDCSPKLIGGWSYIGNYTGSELLVIGLYRRNLGYLESEYALVNKGTNFGVWNDIVNDVQQPLGFSDDLKESIAYAKAFVGFKPNKEITFVGHSKGGAEAAANAIATNRPAIIFNPAPLSIKENGLTEKNKTYDAKMDVLIVDGDILDVIFDTKNIFESVGSNTNIIPLPALEKINWYDLAFWKIKKNIVNHDSPAIKAALGME